MLYPSIAELPPSPPFSEWDVLETEHLITPRPIPGTRPLGPGGSLQLEPPACLPDRFPQVECQRCANACPTAALSARGAAPVLGDGCVGCGQCVLACPTGALEAPGFRFQPAAVRGATTIDCWRVRAADSPKDALRLPCLGGLSTAALLELTAASTDSAPELLDRGFCQQCPAGGQVHPAAKPLAEAHRLLREIGVPKERWPRLTSRRLPIARMADSSGEPLMEERLSRRALLTGGTAKRKQPPVSTTPVATGPERRGERTRLFAALERLAPDRGPPAWLFPHIIASDSCANHQVCASACPAGAIRPYRWEGAAGVRFDPAACTACGLCVALCPEQALTLVPTGLADSPRTLSTLSRHAERTCPECGADHQGSGDLCPSCEKDRGFARDAFHTLFGAASP